MHNNNVHSRQWHIRFSFQTWKLLIWGLHRCFDILRKLVRISHKMRFFGKCDTSCNHICFIGLIYSKLYFKIDSNKTCLLIYTWLGKYEKDNTDGGYEFCRSMVPISHMASISFLNSVHYFIGLTSPQYPKTLTLAMP